MAGKLHPLKQLHIIHTALLMGQLIFSGISIFLFANGFETPQMKEYDRVFQLIAIALAGGGFLTGTAFFKKQIRAARDSQAGANEKFAAYRKASLLLWALLEAPSLVSILFFYLTGNYAFIILAAAIIFLFAIFGPSRQKIMLYLNIDGNAVDDL